MNDKLQKGKKEAACIFLKESVPQEQQPEKMEFAVNYLYFFGYLAVELLQHVDAETLLEGVKKFQKTFGLVADGIVGPKTLRAMQEPRCGCPDHLDNKNQEHIQFLNAQEISEEKRDRWNRLGLTYAIESYVSGKVRPREQDKIIASAFLAWDKVCGVQLEQIKDIKKADIVVSTGRGMRHNFDGRGGVLAWAYMPQGNNKQLMMRFDLDETWVSNPKDRGILIHNVACHEFGHILGLKHSTRPKALMAPYYNPFVANPQMDDDIPRIQKLYGKNPNVAALTNVDQIGEELTTVELKAGQKLLVVVK